MAFVEERVKTGGSLLEEMKILKEMQDQSGVKKMIHSELWHACAGPLVSLPQVGSLVYYFPQGHSEQVAVSAKRCSMSQVPNYPNLPSQLLCQVHNVTLHADKDTDEVFAQMGLQPVISEKDVLPIPDFGPKPSKHPTEFFCKTLTASDTSTHGGFSVPRRAAEKLFPRLDFSMQPPSQELIVRDLHDNTWTFRHIYRGQPKRHLLTTGWSIFVGSKRLRAGDSVLFIRDEKSQLMVGVRHANRQQTALPSSVLSADSMHIGVLAAAAHAAANRSTFTIFYNPRTCPSDFIIPVNKYRKAVFGTQISVGMRFGMMFETEESSKRRYMGTIVGINDLDPLRWPGSKWRSLQVEWDEPGCSDKQNRVSPWEIETPESLFLFPSLTSGFKRPFLPGYLGGEFEWGNLMKRPLIPTPGYGGMGGYGSLPYPSMPNLCSEQMVKMLMRPQPSNYPHIQSPCPSTNPKVELPPTPSENNAANPSPTRPEELRVNNKINSEPVVSAESKVTEPLVPVKTSNPNSQENTMNQMNAIVAQSSDVNNVNGSLPLPYVDAPDWLPFASSTLQSLPILPQSPNTLSMFGKQDPPMGQELWSQQDPQYVQCEPNMNGLVDMADDTKTQSGIYSCIEFDPSISNAAFQFSDCLVGNFGSGQDPQPQMTSASLAESQAFSIQDFTDNSGGTSSSNVDFDESNLLQNSSWQQVNPPLRTYTKVQKAGSVGRSIDVTSFRNYDELRSAIECMFGLDGLLTDPRGSGWKLVYVDFENDVLLVGDDPWEEFVSCVRCIRILSPAEVQQMSEEGMQLLSANAT